ncbi:MAG: TetR/AcrR family transcriptional regulator [Polyangiales bacterium]
MATPRRPRTSARKKPKQARSQETVETILAAAAHVFVREGHARATTNRIAIAAGVSIGSLYQYFPSKDAIAVELLRRYRARILSLVSERLSAIEEASFEVVVRALMKSLLRAEGIDPGLHRVLIEQVLRTPARREVHGFEDSLEALLADIFRRVDSRKKIDHDLRAFLVVRVVLAVIHAAIVDRPHVDRDAVADELTRMVVRYVEP